MIGIMCHQYFLGGGGGGGGRGGGSFRSAFSEYLSTISRFKIGILTITQLSERTSQNTSFLAHDVKEFCDHNSRIKHEEKFTSSRLKNFLFTNSRHKI